MKRFIVCIMVFVLMLWFSGNSVHAKTPNRLQVLSAKIDANMEAEIDVKIENEESLISYFFIDGLNFGDEPRVSLESFPESYPLDVTSFSNWRIDAELKGYIPPGTYRLSVARKGFDFSHPEKADSMDVTISDADSDPKSGDSEDPSGALERENIYQVTNSLYYGDTIIKCSCLDKNDIALNGGYKIKTLPPGGCTYPELSILESNIYYSEDEEEENDYYQLVVNYPPVCQSTQIDAYIRCIKVPDPTIPDPDN